MLLAVLCSFLVFAGTASAANVIKIGISGPMKFPAGSDMYIGAKIAADEINANGGVKIGGSVYEIEIVKADSNEFLSVPDAVSALERLISVNKVNFVIGGTRSEAILAQMEVMAENKVVYIMAGGGSPLLTEQVGKNYDKYKYFFRTTTPHGTDQVKCFAATIDIIAKKLRKEYGIQTPKVAMILEKAVWVDSVAAYGRSIMPKLGLEIVGEWRPSPTANDLSSELTAIKNSGAHIIFTTFSGPVGVVFGKQWGSLEIPAIPVGTNVEAQSLRYWKATGGKCEYEITAVAGLRAAISPKTIQAFDKFVEIKGDAPVYTAFGGYDGVYILTEAAARAQSLNSDEVVTQLEKTNYLGVSGTIAFLPRGHKNAHDLIYGPGYLTLFSQQWRKGELRLIWPDGQEVNPVIGAGTGWDKLKHKDVVPFEFPPFMVKRLTEK
jgi:branched-chain amino acid transport system substrate-binding protein